MDNAWKTLKQIVLIVLLIYFINFLIYTDFLIKFFEKESKFDFSRYLYKILNLE